MNSVCLIPYPHHITSHFAYQQNKNYEHIDPLSSIHRMQIKLLSAELVCKSYRYMYAAWVVLMRHLFPGFCHSSIFIYENHIISTKVDRRPWMPSISMHSLNTHASGRFHIHNLHSVCARWKLRTENILKEGSKYVFPEQPLQKCQQFLQRHRIFTRYSTTTPWLSY